MKKSGKFWIDLFLLTSNCILKYNKKNNILERWRVDLHDPHSFVIEQIQKEDEDKYKHQQKQKQKEAEQLISMQK